MIRHQKTNCNQPPAVMERRMHKLAPLYIIVNRRRSHYDSHRGRGGGAWSMLAAVSLVRILPPNHGDMLPMLLLMSMSCPGSWSRSPGRIKRDHSGGRMRLARSLLKFVSCLPRVGRGVSVKVKGPELKSVVCLVSWGARAASWVSGVLGAGCRVTVL
jgi:hypothetical protein